MLEQGQWVKNEDMHPLSNVAGRRYRGKDGAEGIYNGWGRPLPDGLEWFFPDDIQPSRVPKVEHIREQGQ